MRDRSGLRVALFRVAGALFSRLLAECMGLRHLGCLRLPMRYLLLRLRLRVGVRFVRLHVLHFKCRLGLLRVLGLVLHLLSNLMCAWLLLGRYSVLGMQRLLLRTASVLNLLLLGVLLHLLGLSYFLFPLLVVLGLTLLHLPLLVFALLRLVLPIQHRVCLQRLFALRAAFTLGLCLLDVFAHLRGVLRLRKTLLLFEFLPRLRHACRLRSRLQIQHQLRAGRCVGARCIAVGRAIRCVPRGGEVKCRLVRRGRLRLLRPHLLQRLTDVLTAGDCGKTVHPIGIALKMRDRAIGTKRTGGAALKFHRAIAGKAMCRARALRRQIDRLAPLRLQFGASDAVAIQRFL
ncbi:hypothetical protein, partial [Xanthomonas nasturtii]|uniref:hypothetical protein n=1 Tax=Xanthomonas nasturtii TaxID=1843581 RepID=UPI002013ADD5